MEPGIYRGMNLQFRYPENWTISEETEEGQTISVTAESPDSAFFAINRYRDSRGPQQVLDEAVQAMKSDYDEVEMEDASMEINKQIYPAQLIRFYYLDLLVTCHFIAIQNGKETLLIHSQAEDRDFDRLQMVFKAMSQTLIESLAK